MSPFRADLIEYDGSRTPLPRLIAEAVVCLFTFSLILLIVWLAS